MLNRLNIFHIVKHHFESFYFYDTGKINWLELALHIFLPLGLGITMGVKVEINNNIGNATIAALSIWGGFLFAMLLPLYDLWQKENELLIQTLNDKNNNYVATVRMIENAVKIMKETFYNIFYGILVCLLAVVFTVLSIFFAKTCFETILACICYIFYIASFLMLLMIIKRIFCIFDHRFSLTAKSK